MKKIDGYGLKICAFQAELFKESLTVQNCSSKIFIRRFMYSDLAARMDANGFYYASYSITDAFDEIDRQYGHSSYGQTKYGPEEMYWMGYLYRYWTYTHENSSKQLYHYIKPEDLSGLYYPYHSLDPSQAIERILESRREDDDMISKGVRIMRRIRSRT